MSSSDSSPSKRFTDETYASRAQASNATHASTPADLALQLRSVGSRVRKNVMEGYHTQRNASAPSSPTNPPRAAIFTSANDILRDVYASAASHSPVSPTRKKRAREDDSDAESGGTMAVDFGAERGDDIESDGETVIILARGARPVKPRPRRPLMQTQSLPSGMFGFYQGPLSDQNVASVSEQSPEADWSVNSSSTSSQPPAFEAMVL